MSPEGWTSEGVPDEREDTDDTRDEDEETEQDDD